MSSTHNHCFSHHHYQAWCHQIFFVNNTKIFVTPSVFKLQEWFLHQNGVESNQESKSDDSGPFYNVTERCEAVREVPKDVLKMASGLISPSGHCGQLCTGSHFARREKSAAAAAITLSTQGVNEPQIELLQQTNYSWCILRCFMIYPWVNILSDS